MKSTMVFNLASFRFAARSSLLRLKGEVIIEDRGLLPWPFGDLEFLHRNSF